MPKRKSLSKKIRFEVFKRDLFACQYCGETPPKAVLEVDHINPVSKGGGNEMDNLVTSCFECNRGKAANELSSIPMPLKEKAKLVAESERQLAAYNEILQGKKDRLESDTWEILNQYYNDSDLESANRNIFQSTKNFVEQLGIHEVSNSVDIALAKYPQKSSITFKYFCGICWRKIERSDVS